MTDAERTAVLEELLRQAHDALRPFAETARVIQSLHVINPADYKKPLTQWVRFSMRDLFRAAELVTEQPKD